MSCSLTFMPEHRMGIQAALGWPRKKLSQADSHNLQGGTQHVCIIKSQGIQKEEDRCA